MKLRPMSRKLALLTIPLLALWTWPATQARATLGEKVESVEATRQLLGASRHADTQHAGYTVHEIATPGLTLREYAGPNGIIFGAAWEGTTHPDLAPILGTYLGDFAAALKHSKPDPRLHIRGAPSRVEGAKVVVIRAGHMRAVQGKAYLPALLPQAVTADDIK